MAKQIPKMYQNKIEKNFDNTQKVYSTMNDNLTEKKKPSKYNYNIEQKICNIFKSPTYVYKVDVIIETDEGKLEKRVIGKNKNNLITIDNEYISIDKIRDIYLK